MNIVIHCMGMPFNGGTIKKKSLGGSETAAYYMARELAARGHRVSLFTTSEAEGEWEGVKYIFCGQPTNTQPLGSRFHFYAENTPHDICIIQRHPYAFRAKWASKINLLWMHDLALHRSARDFGAQMWNVDGVLTVSEWHKKQICAVYGFSPEIVYPITNGVDLSLFEGEIESKLPLVGAANKKFLLYSSRPERGLEHLVRDGGIMERLEKEAPEAHLLVCNYDNTTEQTRDYYAYLEALCEKRRNVSMIGHLTKKQLADTMRACTLHVYPTEFEEVSCITAMECMAAGLPMVTSKVAALPETCAGAGVRMLDLKGEAADEEAFVSEVAFMLGLDSLENEKKKQLAAAQEYSWPKAAGRLLNVIDSCLERARGSSYAIAKHLMRMSDIYALDLYLGAHRELDDTAVDKELSECYGFAFNNTFKEHYEAYYEYEKNRGINYGPEILDGNTRYEHVASLLAALPAGSSVLDYGCAHGHYTVNLAKRYPDLRFVGVDLAASNVEKARKWAADDGVKNARFYCGQVFTDDGEIRTNGDDQHNLPLNGFDAIIAAEVLEHVADPIVTADILCRYLKPTGMFIGTTPFGPWEAQGYEQHWPWRAHLWHFEKDDLHDIWGMHKDFSAVVAPSGKTPQGELLGSYIFTFGKPTAPSGKIDYDRKFRMTVPRQTVSVCMIARDAALTIGKCLESVKPIADEIIVAVDDKTKDDTAEICLKYGAKVFTIESPTVSGFDVARNKSISDAKGDWILWIDADEVLYQGVNVVQFLRNNMFNGFATPQHHYSAFPAGIIKTDFPCRFFRNRKGIKFFGVVHEHPEIEINKGVGQATVLSDTAIGHYGYSTEAVRRGRFDRNIGLLVRDRETYPDRYLGKFLWLRDLAQMCQWEAEQNGGHITPAMVERARVGLAIWEELLEAKQTRMLLDGMDFYSVLAKLAAGDAGFDFAFKMDSSKMNGGTHIDKQPAIQAFFASRAHAEKLVTTLLMERTNNYDSKYF